MGSQKSQKGLIKKQHIYIYTSHLLYSFFVDRYLGGVHILAIVNNAVMNIGMYVSFGIRCFHFFFFLDILRREISK